MTLYDLDKFMWSELGNFQAGWQDKDIDEAPLRKFGITYDELFAIYDNETYKHRGKDWTQIKVKITEGVKP